MKYVISLCAALPVALLAADLSVARDLYARTDYAGALRELGPLRSAVPEALVLAGKANFQLERFAEATQVLERAVAARPGDSVAHHWLGKAYGRRAERASFLSAPGLASKCRKSFERAVEAGPRNVQAMSDLLEFYLEAPGLLGGGKDKAAAMAARIANLDAAEGGYAHARLAEKAKDWKTAEEHLRAATAHEPGQAGRWIDLAKFFSRRGQAAASEEMFRKAESAEPGNPAIGFARAEVLIERRHDLAEARRLLDAYIESDRLTPAHPTRIEARRLLERARK